MNILQICPRHLSDVSTLPWEIQKSFFSKTSSNCYSVALAVCLLLFSASYYLHSPSTASSTGGAHVLIWTRWGLRQRLVVTWMNFSTVWCTTRLISVEKDLKHVLIQNVVTLNTCCDTACLTFQLPHITTGSFQSHRRQPKTGFFQSIQRLKERNKSSVRWKFCNSQVSVMAFSSGWASGLQIVFLWDNVNNRMNNTVENAF